MKVEGIGWSRFRHVQMFNYFKTLGILQKLDYAFALPLSQAIEQCV